MNEIQKMTGLLNPLKVLKGTQGKDTRMRFSVEPFAGDSGFTQWHDAMKMCARLPGGIPQEFRRRMWLTLAEQHVRRKNIQWKEVERNCFNEWASPDDEGLGDQIVKDLHRTGCSLFCGEEGEVNQILLKRVLLGYARWNKSVGYCQGFNMLAAIILEVMDRQESDSLKVMIYLIEGVLPESYFANNLRGLSVDMAVFRELLRIHLPTLSRHLETLQQEAADQATGACYEPPLTNVFTMQWFLTLFSNCLPRDVVMRVWDLTFLHGNEMLLRTALAVWGRFASRIMEVPTADEFYCVMGNLTREMLTYGLMDANQLVQTLIGMAPFPFPGLAALRDKFTYNITPWTMTSVARKGLKIFYLDDDDDDEEKGDHEDVNHTMAVATAFGLAGILRKTSGHLAPSSGGQDGRSSPVQGPHSLRPNLDISALKKQYARLRERQRQAHVILTASNIRRKSIDEINKLPSLQKTNQITMKHLLRGKKALTSRTKRVVPQGVIPNIMTKKKPDRKFSDGSIGKSRSSKQSKCAVSNVSRTNTSKPKKEEIIEVPPLSPVAIAHQQLMPKRSLPEEDQVTKLGHPALPPTTIHWKDTPRRVRRRASLPYGVKLMDGGTIPNLPDIKDGDDDDIEDEEEGSSTSTELCDEDLLADLSEEEATVETESLKRPLSTSPRLEHHHNNGNSEDRLTDLLKDKTLVNQLPIPLQNTDLPALSEENTDSLKKAMDYTIQDVVIAPPILENIPKVLDTAITVEKPITDKCKPPTNLEIPEIMASLSLPEPLGGDLSKRSLSSPTKWKWSFSEIENPAIFEPVSPILKLHNFLSDESPKEEPSTPLPILTPQPEINIEKDITNTISPATDDCQVHQRSNIFAYLFEITDVTKLSNVNSEEPSPIEDKDSKISPILNIEKLNSGFLPLDLKAMEESSKPISPKDQLLPTWNESIISSNEPSSNKPVSFQNKIVQQPLESVSSPNTFIFTSNEKDSLLEQPVSFSSQLTPVPKEEIVPNSSPNNLISFAPEADILNFSNSIEEMSKTNLCESSSSYSESPSLTAKKVSLLADTSFVPSEIGNSSNDTGIYTPVKYTFDLAAGVHEKETTFSKFISPIQVDAERFSCDKSNNVLASSVLDDVTSKIASLASTHITLDTLSCSENYKEIEDPRLAILSDFKLNEPIFETNLKLPDNIEKPTLRNRVTGLMTANNETGLTSLFENNSITTIQESSSLLSTLNIKQEIPSCVDTLVNPAEKDPLPNVNEYINKISSSDHEIEENFNSASNSLESQTLNDTICQKETIGSYKNVPKTDNKIEDDLIRQLVSDVSCVSEDEKDKVTMENNGDTLLENSDLPIKSVFAKERKSDISSLSENNLSLDYFAKSDLGLEDIDIELPPMSHSFKVHPKFKDTPKSKSWDNDVSSNFDFSKFKKLKSNLSESFGDATNDKNTDSDNEESRRCYFSKILRSLSLESDLYEEIVNTSQNGIELEEDSELIRRKIWAGVKSLSLDAELLIATNKDQKSCIDISTSSMPALDESPTDGSKDNGHNDSQNGTEETPTSILKRFQKRRKSEAALKLMKENTKIIDKILNQRYDEWMENNSGMICSNEFQIDPDTIFLTRKSSSDHSISDCVSNDLNMPKCFDNTTTTNLGKENTFPTNHVSEPNSPCKLVTLPDKGISFTNSEKMIRQNAIESASTTEENESISVKLRNQTSITYKECNDPSQNISLNADTDSTENTANKRKVMLKSAPTQAKKIIIPGQYEAKNSFQNSNLSNDSHQTNITSQSSPFPTSKYFSSILTPENIDNSINNAKPVAKESSTAPSCSPNTKNVPRNVKYEKKSASRSQTVPFSKLSKLSPKTSLQKSQADKSQKNQLKLKPSASNSNGISDNELAESNDSKSRQQIFNPFPTKPLERPPKDVGVKLGLYSTTKTNNT